MNLVRLRNGKARLVAGVALVALIILVTYVIHDTHTKLVSTRGLVRDCDHKRESLAAQLQVTFEHKSRLEKALQQEKLAHTHMKDKLESQYEELQEQMDKEKQEANRKYSTLLQQKEALQNQQETLYKEFSSLQQTNSELQEEKQNLVNKMTSQLDQLRIIKDEELLQLQSAYNKLQKEKDDLFLKLEKSTATISQFENDLKTCQRESSVMHDTMKATQNTYLTEKEKMPSVAAVPVMVHPIPSDMKLVKLEEESRNDILPGNPAGFGVKIDGSNNNYQEEQKRVGPPPPNAQRSPSHVSPSKLEPIADANDGHQIAIPAIDSVEKPKEKNGQQVEEPNHLENDQKKNQQLVEPPVVQLHRTTVANGDMEYRVLSSLNTTEPVGREAQQDADQRIAAVFRRDAELVPNGLEQQENGGDQDLDDVENEVDVEKHDNNRFEDADFDQADQDDNDGNRAVHPQLEIKPDFPEGVIAVPHK